ncbi:aminopeptidase N [Sphingomonas gellani]|uniref:Aminopeptidase n=1 Tax=Sphingomonas gellani TaxID=1166340 RepID=A0A1H7YYT4_9SPHN|nr:M1 family metallopeptidase [Sphingomonas gellani]SEM51296.1 aminopeptidase N [Sphingomonas gellani]
MKLAALTLLSLTASTGALAQARLPSTVVPVAYDIAVSPNAAALTFSGTETVTVDVKAPTRTVVLNAADLSIRSAAVDGRKAAVSLDKEGQRLTLTLPSALAAGRHALTLAWDGKINQSAAGLFAIDYSNTDGSKSRMLATQFEAPDARRFAPMFDEPAFKATFTLSALAPKGQLAFSNMPATSVATEGAMQRYRFATTPKMSSYLLFLGMGDMERKTVKAGNVEIGVITRRGVVDQGDYALASAKKLLAYYNDYFGQPYPLPKMDMIAGPGSSQFFGAMENWGAIFYFEPELLFDAKRATESNRQRIYTVVAHEMAHQWFGDLVTMGWWDDLWLNEGFASWMEGKASADLNPSWKADAQSLVTEREAAIGLDATAATHPIVRHVETPDQISEAFDTITYQKGQAVIGMLESTLGENAFRDGIRRYMARYKYGNTATDQLWAELAAASGRPVADIAHTFTLQGGVPLVTVSDVRCEGGRTGATLTQGRFGVDQASKTPQSWQVPLSFGVPGSQAGSTVLAGPTASRVTAAGCGAFVANLGKGSYTRVRYEGAAHDVIVRDYAKLSLKDRIGTLGDEYGLATGGYQDLDRYFEMMAQVGPRSDALEWSAVARVLSQLKARFASTPLEQPLRARTLSLLQPQLARIGIAQRAGEEPPVTNLREDLLSLLGSSGDPQVAAEARRYVAALKTNPDAIPPAIRQPVLQTYAINATPAEWDGLLAMVRAETNPVVKNGYVAMLGGARDEAIARRALDLLPGGTLTPPQGAILLRAVASNHPDLAFDWAVAHRQLVESFLETSTRAGFITGLGAGSVDPAMPGKIRAFANANLPAAARGPSERTIARMAAAREVAARLQPAVARWTAR